MHRPVKISNCTPRNPLRDSRKKNKNLTEAQNQANWKMYEARRSLQGREQKRMPRLQQQSAKIQ